MDARFWRDRGLFLEPPAATLALAAIVLLAALLRFGNIASEPLWLDEATTLRFAELAQAQLWGMPLDTNPPLYYALQRLWLVLGDGAAALRSLSAVIGIACVGLIAVIGREAAGPRAGIIAAALLATSAFHIQYSQEARAYALLMLALMAATLGLLRIGRRFEEAAAAPGPTAWCLYVLGSLAALYAHSTAMLFLAVANLVVTAFWLRGARDLAFAGCWLAANLLILAGWAWWLPVVLTQSGGGLEGFWLLRPSLLKAAGTVLGVYGAPYAYPVGHVIGLCLVVTGLFGAWQMRRRPFALALLGGFVVLIPLLTYAVSFRTPIFMLRVILWPLFAWLVFVAAGVTALPLRSRPAALAALLAVQLWGVAGYEVTPIRHEPWDRVAHQLAVAAAPGDLVLVCEGDARLPLAYYLHREGVAIDALAITAADVPRWRQNLMRPPIQTGPPVDVTALGPDLASHRRVWLVERQCQHETPIGVALTAGFTRAATQRFDVIGLTLFERDAQPAQDPETRADGSAAHASAIDRRNVDQP